MHVDTYLNCILNMTEFTNIDLTGHLHNIRPLYFIIFIYYFMIQLLLLLFLVYI